LGFPECNAQYLCPGESKTLISFERRENETRVGPNMGPKLFQNCFRQAADDVGGGLPQKHRRIVTAPIGNHMHRNSSIK